MIGRPLPLAAPSRTVDVLWALRSACTRNCDYCFFGTLEMNQAQPVTAPGVLSHLSRSDVGAEAAIAFARTLADSAVRRVFVAGGEPLSWRPTLKVIAELKAAGVEVVVCTDGTALNNPEITAALLELGVDGVSVSLDSTDADYNDLRRPARNGRDGWHSVVGGVRALLAARGERPTPRVGLYSVITRQNIRDIVNVPTFAAQLGCDYAVPQPVSLEADHPLFDTLALRPEDAAAVSEQYAALYASGLPLGIPSRDYPQRVRDAVEHPVGQIASCFGGSTLFFIEPDGSVWDCPSALRIAATPAEARRSIVGHTAAELFPEPTGSGAACELFSADCVCMWPLTGFDRFATPAAVR